MIELDARTLMFGSALFSLTLPLAIWIALKDDRHHARLVWSWAFAGAISGVGILCFTIRDLAPVWIGLYASNIFLCGAIIAGAQILYSDRTHRYPIALPLISLALFSGAIVAFESTGLHWERAMSARIGLCLACLALVYQAARSAFHFKAKNPWAIATAHTLLTISFANQIIATMKGAEFTPLDHATVALLPAIAGVITTSMNQIGFVGFLFERNLKLSIEQSREQARQYQLRSIRDTLANSERDTAKRIFSNQINHDISQPVTSLSINLQMMTRALQSSNRGISFDEHAKRAINDIDRAERLMHLYGKDPSLTATPDYDWLDFRRKVMEPALSALKSQADNIGLTVHISDKASALILGDSFDYQRVMINVLTNALEALASTKNPTITIKTRNRDYGNIEVAIIDNGPGLSPAEAHSVGSAFYTSKPNGLGLGLTVCKDLMHRNRGLIQWKNSKPVGFEVNLLFPTRVQSRA
jgi:signal transduction histidine kinase